MRAIRVRCLVLAVGAVALMTACSEIDPVDELSGSPDGAEATEQAEQGLVISEICLTPTLESRTDGDARLSVALEGSEEEWPPVLSLTMAGSEEPLILTDEGTGVDEREGDGIYSRIVRHELSDDEPGAICGSALDWEAGAEGFDAAPEHELIEAGEPSTDALGGCPGNEGDCYYCDGVWRPLYCCSYWYGCYQCGNRCYGCSPLCRLPA